jgi:hypothetical protein
VTERGTKTLRAAFGIACLLLAAGCVVKETRPMPKLVAAQATTEIPAEQLLDVGIRLFDTGLAKDVEDHAEEAAKKGIYPDIRKAEARYLPNLLRTTLEGTGQWGAVRVLPPTASVMDVMVEGRIVESNGYRLALDVTVGDATGRRWLSKRYAQEADTASYRDGPGRARDPFQNVYAQIADDMLKFRQQLASADLAAIPRVAKLRFGKDLVPVAYGDYLAQGKLHDGQPQYRVVRLPAEDDPVVERVDRIRERDGRMIDTVSDYYTSFAEKMSEPYAGWRRSTYDEIEAEEKLRRQAMTRKVLGAAAVVAGILAPSVCGSGSYTCSNVETAVRAGAIGGGVMAVMSGIQKGKEAQMHTDTLKEITGSFQTEAAPMVVDVEGRTLKLTGTAEAQYAEWRRLLHDLYQEETGIVGGAAPPAAAEARAQPVAVSPSAPDAVAAPTAAAAAKDKT